MRPWAASSAGLRHGSWNGFSLWHRRAAECRQVDPVQRADRDGGGAGGQLSVLHDRAECRRRRGARSAARRARRIAKSATRSRPSSSSSTSPAWSAAPRRARASATSSSPTSARSTPSSMCCAASRTATSPMSRARSIPIADAETVETELMLADLESLEKRAPNRVKKAQQGDKEAKVAGLGARPGARPAARVEARAPGEGRRGETALGAGAAADLQARPLRLQRRRGATRRRRQRPQRAGLRRGEGRRRAGGGHLGGDRGRDRDHAGRGPRRFLEPTSA